MSLARRVPRSASPASSRPKRAKLTRAERQQHTRERLFEAAARLVGKVGYAETTIGAITRLAGVAPGTFYNYFASRQDLLDQLLPVIGQAMLDHVRTRLQGVSGEVAREEMRFRAFFEFLTIRPEFYRILHEAEQFAPSGFYAHTDGILAGYARALRRSRDGGAAQPFADAEIEVVSLILMAARDYIAMRYAVSRGRAVPIPEDVVAAYMRLLRHGLFRPPQTRRRAAASRRAVAGGEMAAPQA